VQVLMTARRAMESITLDRGEMHMKDDFSPRYAEMVYNGLWFSPERYALQAAVDATQNFVTGVVRVDRGLLGRWRAGARVELRMRGCRSRAAALQLAARTGDCRQRLPAALCRQRCARPSSGSRPG